MKKNCAFWGTAPFSHKKRHPTFRRNMSLPPAGWKNKALFSTLLHAGFLLGSVFGHEDGDIFLQNIG
jgi:hypothetical protein